MSEKPETKLVQMLGRMLDGYDPVAAIVEGEQARGFTVIRPGDAPWFSTTDWRPASMASIKGMTARLVLIHAIQSNRGAFTRTVAGIRAAMLLPAVIDPTRPFAEMLTRRSWKGKAEGSTFEDRETVWRPLALPAPQPDPFPLPVKGERT